MSRTTIRLALISWLMATGLASAQNTEITKPEVEEPLPHTQSNHDTAKLSPTASSSEGLFQEGDAGKAMKERAQTPGERNSEVEARGGAGIY